MVHWHAMNRKDSEALRRLAVVLLTLASVAEGVALRTGPFRGLVLWLLCRAEVRARGLAFRIGGIAAPASISAGSPVGWLGGAGEAARLAQRFRALAADFTALSHQAARGLRTARRNGSVSLFADCWTVMRRGRRPGHYRPCIDTS
jgi:hypothetical protein